MDLFSMIVALGVGIIAGGVLMHAFGSSIKREVSMLHDRVSTLESKAINSPPPAPPPAPVVHVVQVPPPSAMPSSPSV